MSQSEQPTQETAQPTISVNPSEISLPPLTDNESGALNPVVENDAAVPSSTETQSALEIRSSENSDKTRKSRDVPIASLKQMTFEFVKIARLMHIKPSYAYETIRGKQLSYVRTPADFLREMRCWASQFFGDEDFSILKYEEFRRETEQELLEFGLSLDPPEVKKSSSEPAGEQQSEDKRAPQPRAAPTNQPEKEKGKKTTRAQRRQAQTETKPKVDNPP